METISCWQCDEYTERGSKHTGYCSRYDRPTWKSTIKNCINDTLADSGKFCFYECLFSDDMDGYMCGDESPLITDMHKCPRLQERLNDAFGGSYEYNFYTRLPNGEIQETICMLGEQPYTWIVPERVILKRRFGKN